MLEAYMTDTVTLKVRSGTSTWGVKATTSSTVRARIEDKAKLIRNAAGENIMVQAVVYIRETTLAVGDVVTISGVDHPILTVKKLKAFSQVAGMELGIG